MLRSTVALTLAAASLVSAQTTRPAGKPNVVVIVVDDLGYNDLGVQGSDAVKTPNIDALAAAGVRFTSAYASCPVCAPTRAGLITGRYQQRFGFEQNPLPSADRVFGLPATEGTLADHLKAVGYRTAGFGKWHLGNEPPYYPTKRGFDEWFGFLGGMHKLINNAQPEQHFNAIRRGDEPVGEPAYFTDALNREAVAFIERNVDRPFFLYLPYNAPHVPLQAPPKYRKRFEHLTDQRRMMMCAMMAAVDDGVGEIGATLKRHGLDENTLVFFASDNGGPGGNGTSNAPFRGRKGETLEGGIRVPFIMRWPGRVPAGRIDDRPMILLDVAATALAAAGTRSDKPLDGVDLVPFVNGNDGPIHEALFWRFGPRKAVRSGQWKMQWHGDEPRALYDVTKDPAESTDVSATHADVAKRLSAEWETWNATLAKPLWPGRLEGGENDPAGLGPASQATTGAAAH